jgi:hypothetical protein
MYSGDEEISDGESTDDDQYDHDFEPEQVCLECGEGESNCECEEGGEIGDGEECLVCGMSEADPVHGGE